MRPFPPRTISKNNIPIITPLFFGYTRGSDGNSKSLKNKLPKTSLEMIKCLRPASYNAIPIKDVSSRYGVAPTSKSQSMSLPPKRINFVPKKRFMKINSSVY
jgi:hypothetical protein